jgi:hypothetical protein
MSADGDDVSLEGSSEDSYSTQLSDSLNNFLFGIVLLLFTTYFMWTLEGAVVRFFAILKRCQLACRFVKTNTVINPDFQNRVVLVKGVSKLHGRPLCNSDTETGFKADTSKGNVLRLRRKAQMYQWIEERHTKSKKNSRDEVYYTYSLEWSEVDMDSSSFHDTASSSGYDNQHDVYNQGGGGGIQYQDSTHVAHKNPRARQPDIQSKSIDSAVNLGAYLLSTRQVGMMASFTPCVINPADVANAPNKPNVEIDTTRSGGKTYYLTYKPSNASRQCSIETPEVGMVRVTYEAVMENGHVTTVGVQNGSTFRPFTEEDAKKYESGACFGLLGDDNETAGSGTYSALSNEESGGYGDDAAEIENDGIDLIEGSSCSIVGGLINKCVSFVVGDDVLLLEEKWTSIKDMFQHSNASANLRVMVMRVVGMLLMWFAISAIFDPIRTILTFIPLIGGLAAGLFGLVTGILAFLLGMTIIAISWTAFHPEILFSLLAGVGAVCVVWGDAEWDVVGYVLCAASLYPLAVWANIIVQDRRFAAAQRELDMLHTAPPTIQADAQKSGDGEKAGLLRA